MRFNLLLATVAVILFAPPAAFAGPFTANLPNGDHGSHPPMGPPLSVVCAPLSDDAQFICLHPSYVKIVASNTGLSDGVPSGPLCHSTQTIIVGGVSTTTCRTYH